MRRALLVCAAITFAIACTDNITEPVPDRPDVTPGAARANPTVAFATTTTEDGLSISTDKDDYQPGDVVHLTGYGWQPGDVLDIVLTDDPLTHEPHTWTVEVGSDGMFHDQTYVVDEGDLDVAFTLVATSRATGRSLTVRFTDSNPGTPSVTGQTPNPAPAGDEATYTVTIVFGGNATECTVTLSGTTLDPPTSPAWPSPPAGGFFSFSPATLTAPGQPGAPTRTSVLTVKTTGLAANTTYRFRVNAAAPPAAGCQGGDEVSANVDLVVGAPANVAPVVDAGGPYSGNRNVPISLGGATATDADGDALAFTWTYTPVAGNPCSFSDATALNPTFTCTATGTFTVTLSVNDGKGHVVTDNAEVTVANGAPTAAAGGDYSGSEGTALALAGSGTDPNGDVLSYKWTYVPGSDVDAGATCSFDDDTKEDAKVTCTDDGTFKLTLEVKDPDGLTNSDYADLVLTNVKPNASAGGPVGGYSTNEGSALQLDGLGDDPGTNDNPHLTYKWTINTTGIDAGGACTFDDDEIEDPKITCTDDSNLGEFTLSLVVKDDDLGTSEAGTAVLRVNNVKPVANAGGGATGYSGEEGSAIQLAGSADDPGDNDDPHLTYQWTVNTAGIDASGACTFDDDNKKDAKVTCTDDSDNATGGSFKLTLIASDDEGNASIESYAKLTVANAGPVADAGPDYTGSEGSPVQLQGSVTDAGANDTHVWLWKYVAGAGVDAGATCSFSPNAAAEDPTITCTDDGTVELTLKVKDDDGAESSDVATLTLTNVDPVANAGPATYTGVEGSPVQLQGSVLDAGGNDTHTWYWKYVNGTTVDAGATCSFYPSASAEDPTITCTDDGAVELTLKVTDDDGGSGSDLATLNLSNANPVASAGGPYTIAEGTPQLLAGSANDPGDNDDPGLTYKWSVITAGVIDAGGACTFDDDTKKDATVTCTDDSNLGKFTLSLVATDDDGGVSLASTADLTVTNADPIATPGGPYSGAEGQAIQLSGSGDDPGNNDDLGLTYLWASSAPSTCTFDATTSKTAKVTCNDNGNFTLTLTVKDDDGGTGANTTPLTVTNVPPVITTVTVSPTVVQVGAPVTLNATFTDQGTGDTHTASINWEGATSSGTVTEADGSGSVSGSHSYTATGIYTVTLTVTDDEGASDTEAFPQYIVVYDPSAGFVTGGGWINSQAGAYRLDQTLTGKANFGFVSKYQKGANTPTGNTEFQFHAGSLNFSSTVYEWLVVQGQTKASYKGSGTVNGASGYGFLLSVIDNGSSGDRFRMKIWNKTTGAVVYDNQYGADDEASAAQYTAGGSIVIHTNGGVASK